MYVCNETYTVHIIEHECWISAKHLVTNDLGIYQCQLCKVKLLGSLHRFAGIARDEVPFHVAHHVQDFVDLNVHCPCRPAQVAPQKMDKNPFTMHRNLLTLLAENTLQPYFNQIYTYIIIYIYVYIISTW